jgi:hypothetical protein
MGEVKLYESSSSKGTKRIDYVTFSFDGVHSSELGIIRTTDGSRYEENLLPTIQDKTVQVPGGDGTYIFGSYFTQIPFSFPIAFDGMSETQRQKLRKVLAVKTPKKLILDETPYKYYLVKPTGTPSFKYIPFDETCDETDEGAVYRNGNWVKRVYKGEGTLNFLAYSPYAYNNGRYLDDFSDYDNLNEWAAASNFLQSQGNYDTFASQNGLYNCKVYNSGTEETHYKLYFTDNSSGRINAITLSQGTSADDTSTILSIKTIALESGDTSIRINTKLNLIEGLNSSGEITGNIYNKYIDSGTFEKLPVGESVIQTTVRPTKIEYDFLYI